MPSKKKNKLKGAVEKQVTELQNIDGIHGLVGEIDRLRKSETDSSDSGEQSKSSEPTVKPKEEKPRAATRKSKSKSSEPTITNSTESTTVPTPAPEIRNMASPKSASDKTRRYYSVSSDIKLDEFSQNSKPRYGWLIKLGALILVTALIIWGVNRAIAYFYPPNYQLAIATEEITDDNIASFTDQSMLYSQPSRSTYIRFQWQPGEMSDEYLIMKVEVQTENGFAEVASKGRRLPLTVSYIYFSDMLLPGRYRITVTNRDEDILKIREVTIQ